MIIPIILGIALGLYVLFVDGKVKKDLEDADSEVE